jgi:hypothetical protein
MSINIYQYFVTIWNWFKLTLTFGRSQWPRGIRRGSGDSRLMGMRVRILEGGWMFVMSVVCCQVEVSATSWSLVQRIPTDCGVSFCDIETWIMRRKCLVMGRSAMGGGRVNTREFDFYFSVCMSHSGEKVNNCWQMTRRVSRGLTQFIATYLLRVSGAKSDY